MDRLFHHLLRGLVVVLGLASPYVHAQSRTCGLMNFEHYRPLIPAQAMAVDEGEAFVRCLAIRDVHPPYGRALGGTIFAAPSGRCSTQPDTRNMLWIAGQPTTLDANNSGQDCAPVRASSQPSWSAITMVTIPFQHSCATRPELDTFTYGIDPFVICEAGCRYSVAAKACDFLGADGIYTCAVAAIPDGSLCTSTLGLPVAPRPPDPENPDRDGDGVPNDQDDAPDDPGCSVDCGPQPPPEDEPDPGPEDQLDDGQQVTENLGPKLDKIEQAVLGLGPKVDAVRTAVDNARSDANADADRMVSAIDAVASAIRAQGPNGPGDPGEPGGGDGDEWDWTPGTPGPDGGELPSPSSVIENADAGQLMSQLDQDGWSLPRGCPALRWPQSFDLGWGAFDMAMPINIVCTALAILGWVIGLAGLIQASFILSRIGQN